MGVKNKKKCFRPFRKVGNSIEIDKRLYKEDIAGSIAHVKCCLNKNNFFQN